MGVVEDVQDPENRGRVKVRIVGIHSEDKTLVPTDALPWAEIGLPANNPMLAGRGTSPNGLLPGSCVGGIFTDPDDMQSPLVLFAFGGDRAPGGDVNAGAFNAMGTAIYSDNKNSGCITADNDPEKISGNNSDLLGGGVSNSTHRGTGKSYPNTREGLRIKNNEDHNGGTLKPQLYTLGHWIQKNIVHFDRITSGNDIDHKGTKSFHAVGQAIDITVKDVSTSSIATTSIRNIYISAGLKPSEYELINEYTNPSARSSGGHIHTAFRSDASADKFVNFVNSGGVANNSSPTYITPTGTPNWMTSVKAEVDSPHPIEYYSDKINASASFGSQSAVFVNWCLNSIQVKGTGQDSADVFTKHGAFMDIGVFGDYLSGKKAPERGAILTFSVGGVTFVGFSSGEVDQNLKVSVYYMSGGKPSMQKVNSADLKSIRWPKETAGENGTAPSQRNYNKDCSAVGEPQQSSSGGGSLTGDFAEALRALGEIIVANESAKGDAGYNIANRKSGNGYARADRNFTSMTIGEVIALMNQGKSVLFATGKYQIIPTTLKGYYGPAGLGRSDLFNKQNQDKLFEHLCLHKAGGGRVSKFLKGKTDITDAIYGLSMEWSSIINPRTGRSYYPKDHARTTTAQLTPALTRMKETYTAK